METATLRKRLPTKEERAQVGKAADAIYAPLRERLEKEHWGEYIAINVENGDYAVAPGDLEVSQAIKARDPGIIPYVIRIGYKAVVHFGGTGVSDGIRPEEAIMLTGIIEQSRYPKLVLPLVAQEKRTDLKFLVDTHRLRLKNQT